jgi:hypothetical protein
MMSDLSGPVFDGKQSIYVWLKKYMALLRLCLAARDECVTISRDRVG